MVWLPGLSFTPVLMMRLVIKSVGSEAGGRFIVLHNPPIMYASRWSFLLKATSTSSPTCGAHRNPRSDPPPSPTMRALGLNSGCAVMWTSTLPSESKLKLSFTTPGAIPNPLSLSLETPETHSNSPDDIGLLLICMVRKLDQPMDCPCTRTKPPGPLGTE